MMVFAGYPALPERGEPAQCIHSPVGMCEAASFARYCKLTPACNAGARRSIRKR